MSLLFWAMRRREGFGKQVAVTDEGWEYSVPIEKPKPVDPVACAVKSQVDWASMPVGKACPECGHSIFAHPPGYCDICRFERRLQILEKRVV